MRNSCRSAVQQCSEEQEEEEEELCAESKKNYELEGGEIRLYE